VEVIDVAVSTPRIMRIGFPLACGSNSERVHC